MSSKIPYASIYTLDGTELCSGLQGCNTCDEAIQAAERTADRLRSDVHLVDDDGEWIVHPTLDGVRKPPDPCGEEDAITAADLLDLAVDHLDAAKQEDGDYYYDARDEGHLRLYVVTESDMIKLGRMLHDGQADAYSHWCAGTNAQSYRVVRLERDDLTFLVPGRNQGQIVEVSFADTFDGRVLRRTHDRSDGATSYAIADLSDDEIESSDPIGLNGEPGIDGAWDPCVLV